MVATPSGDFLTKKAGALPVWGWGAIGLGAAYAYSRYKANKAATAASASTSGTSTSAAEPSTGAEPYYVIENNLPQSSTPITVNVPGTGVTTTPPGTGPQPPTNQPPPILQGGNPPRGGGPFPPVPPVGTTVPPGTGGSKPTAQRYTVQKGDTLWGIATKFLGSGADYKTIWAYNTNAANRKAAGLPAVQGNNPNLIYPGEVFLIPPKS